MINLQHWSLSLSCVIPFILPRSRRPIQCHADQSPKGVILGSGHCFGVGMEQFLRNLQPRQDCPVIRGFPLVVKSFDRDEWTAQIAPEATEKEAETLEVCYNDAKFAQDEGMMVNQTEMDRFVTPPPPLILASLVIGLGREPEIVVGSLDELIQGNLAAVCGVEQKFQVSGGAGDGVEPESGEGSGGIATVLRQLAKFLRLEGHVSPQPRDEL